MTGLTLITRALQLAGVVEGGESPTATEAADGLLTLNSFVEACVLRGTSLFTRTRVTKALVASQASYAIGPTAADIVRARPVQIVPGSDTATLIDTTATPDLEIPLQILTEDEWADVRQKAMTATRPEVLYYNPTVPNGTIYLWPIGTVATYSLCLYLMEPLTQVTTLATTLVFPPGYERWFRAQLAWEFCGEYGRAPSPVLVEMRREASADVRRANSRPSVMKCDPMLVGAGAMDIETGP